MVGDWKKLKLGANDYWVYDGSNSGYSLITLDTGIACDTGGIVMHNSVELQYYMDQRIAGIHEMAGLSIAEQLYRYNESRLSLKNDQSVEVGSITSLRGGVETGVSEYYCTRSYMRNDNSYVDVSDTSYPAYRANAVYYVKFKILGPSNLLNGSSSHWYIRLQKGNTTRNVQIEPVVTYIHESVWVDGNYTAYVDSISNAAPLYYNNADTGILSSFTTTGHYFLSFIFTNNKDYLGISYFSTTVIDNQPKYGALRTTGANDNIDISDISDDPTPIEEDGFVNEILNRFSPRLNETGAGIGMYLIPYESTGTGGIDLNGIEQVMKGLMTQNIGNVLSNKWLGSDGKEYVIGIRWYYGLLKAEGHVPIFENKHRIRIGPVNLTDDNGILVGFEETPNTEYVEWKTSKLSVPAYFNNYLDFKCSYKLYLPYYGFIDILPNDIVDGTIQVIYNINLFTGIAQILVVCNNDRTENKDTKYYTVSAKVGVDVPFGTNLSKSLDLAIVQQCGKAAGQLLGAYSGGVGNVTQYANAVDQADLNMINMETRADHAGKYFDGELAGISRAEDTAVMYQKFADQNYATEKTIADRNLASSQKQLAANTMSQFSSGLNVPITPRSNAMSNENGNLDELHPYLLITRPVCVEPADYESYKGVPSTESIVLRNVSGFTQVAAVKGEPVPSSAHVPMPKYFNEILSLLQAGVYF